MARFLYGDDAARYGQYMAAKDGRLRFLYEGRTRFEVRLRRARGIQNIVLGAEEWCVAPAEGKWGLPQPYADHHGIIHATLQLGLASLRIAPA